MALRLNRGIVFRLFTSQRRMRTTGSPSDEKYRQIKWVETEYPIAVRNETLQPQRREKEGYLNIDFIVSLQRKIDFSPQSIKRWLNRKMSERKLAFQSAIYERRMLYGVEIGAATFIVQLNGAVRFKNQTSWVKMDKDSKKKNVLPTMPVRGTNVEAIDATNTEIMYEGLDNIIGLRNLQSLSLNGCPHVDDWCMDKISCQMRKNLRHLDLSNCPNVTEKGLLVLPRLRNLTSLHLHNMPRVNFAPLVCILLEDAMPKCKIYGIDYMKDVAEYVESTSNKTELSAMP